MTRLLALALLLAPPHALAAGDPADQPGGRDPALFTRMKGFHIYNFDEKAFDRFEFPVGSGKSEVVEGRHLYVDYYLNDGAPQPSGVQVARNYANAAKAVGGRVVHRYEDGGMEYVTLKVAKGDAETWAFVSAAPGGMYNVHVVERQLMAQDVTADASAMSAGLRATGRVALYGLYFDTDRADLKPSSEPTLAEIAKLLEADGALRLYVVGHTDNQGGLEHNLKLSQARAASVVAALSKRGVAPARLTPFGAGPTAPVAPNDGDAGRAKNRRVELVAQ